MSDGAGQYYMSAEWTMGHTPHYDAVVGSLSRSNKACWRGRGGAHDVIKANVCIPYEGDDGEMYSEKYVVHACDEGKQGQGSSIDLI